MSSGVEIFPEYWVIKVGKFGNRVKDKLDEWIYFFKNAEIKNEFSAKGFKAAGEKLDEMKLNEKDAKEYKKYLKGLRDMASEQHTKMADAQDLINKGREEKEVEFILEMHKAGLTVTQIAKISKKSEHEILKVTESQLNK